MVHDHGISMRQACRRHAWRARRSTRPPAAQRWPDRSRRSSAMPCENPRHGFDKLYPAVRSRGPGFGKCRLYRIYRALAAQRQASGQAAIAGASEAAARDSRASERDLVRRLHVGCALVGSSLPHLQRDRRLQPRSAAHRDRHQPAGCAHRARAGRAGQTPRQAQAAEIDNGPEFDERGTRAMGPSPWRRSSPSSSPADRCRTASSNASTGPTARRCSTEEVLDCYVFETLGEVRRMTADWIVRYNESVRTSRSATSARGNT